METELQRLWITALSFFAQNNALLLERPNFTLKLAESQKMYLGAQILPVPPRPLTIKSVGSVYVWLLQVSVYIRDGSGTADANEVVDKLRVAFPPLHKLVGPNYTFKIMRPADSAQPVPVPGWLSIPVTFRAQLIH